MINGTRKTYCCPFPTAELNGRVFRFLPRLKEECLRKNGNPEFWMQIKAFGRDASLISNKEARQYGGAASVSEKRAEEVSLRRIAIMRPKTQKFP